MLPGYLSFNKILDTAVATLLCTQSVVSTKVSVVVVHTQGRISASWFARRCPYLMRQDMGDSKDCLRLLQVNPNVHPHILTPSGFIYESSIPQLLIVQAKGLISLEYSNCQCKGLMARVHEGSITKAIWVQPTGCYISFLPERLHLEECRVPY